MNYATKAHYTRAAQALGAKPLAPLNHPNTIERLRTLHPQPKDPVHPISDADLPPIPLVTEAAVKHAALKMNSYSGRGPDRMQPRLLRFLATTDVSTETGVTDLYTRTRLVARLSRAGIPNETLPLIGATTLLPFQARPDNIRPIAIWLALRQLATKVLLPSALEDCADYLSPQQMASGVGYCMDTVVPDARMLYNRNGPNNTHIMVSVDASNAFETCSRSNTLECTSTKAPTLARFCEAIYGKMPPPQASHHHRPPFSAALRAPKRETPRACLSSRPFFNRSFLKYMQGAT